MFKFLKKLLIVCLCCTTMCGVVNAQYVYGTTGLLHMPTGEMQQDKTFMFGGSFLNSSATPASWSYDTYNYYINITFFPWLEIGYTCTLNKGGPSKYWPEQTWGKFVNQDRQFSARLRIISEGQLLNYMPSIVLGINDPSTNDVAPGKDDYGVGKVGTEGNGYWNRYYLAMTKHFSFRNAGKLGVHCAYVYNRRTDYHLNGIALGVNFRMGIEGDSFFCEALNQLDLIAEYDSRTVNCGFKYSFWKDCINAVVELTECKYFSGGVVFKIHLR